MEIETAPADKRCDKPDGERRGLPIVDTGNGERDGKATVAIGPAVRVQGHHESVRFFQSAPRLQPAALAQQLLAQSADWRPA